MTAASAPFREPKASPDRDPDSAAAACARLWGAVVLTALNDYWHAVRRAKGDPREIACIRASALAWASSRWGRTVLTMAGIDVDPERFADAAVDLDARNRTLREWTARSAA